MLSNEGFLSPRDLLINQKFCCDGLNFTELTNGLLAAENLPASETELRYKTGLSDTGIQALYTIIWPIVEKFQEIQNRSVNLRVGCRSVKDVCDRTLDLASTAKQDYDVVFDDLEKLFNDSDNDSLRQQVDKTINDRLYTIDIVKDVAEEVVNILRSSTSDIIELQSKLGDLGNALSSPDIEGMLADRDPTEEDVQNDLAALTVLQGIIKNQNMQDQSGPSLNNLEVLLGAVDGLTSDLSGLRQSIQDSAQPGPGLLLDVEEAKVLEQWDLLRAEVQEFNDHYAKIKGSANDARMVKLWETATCLPHENEIISLFETLQRAKITVLLRIETVNRDILKLIKDDIARNKEHLGAMQAQLNQTAALGDYEERVFYSLNRACTGVCAFVAYAVVAGHPN
ncbi:hypothetical protein F5B21DRAFT_504922 [Xylaria acuta]|nr:hypothetical protein F5B21DRAFT_504922 [Xylaria acuta]